MEPVHTLAAAAAATALSWRQTLAVLGIIAITVLLIGLLVILARSRVGQRSYPERSPQLDRAYAGRGASPVLRRHVRDQ